MVVKHFGAKKTPRKVDALGSDRTVSPDDWAFYPTLSSHARPVESEILFAPVRNPGGKKTYEDGISFTPNLRRIEEIEVLLQSATVNRL